MDKKYVFPDKSVLVNHLYNRLSNPTFVKVQKSLYLLWAYYAGTYATLESAAVYPRELFEPDFYAFRYGPVDLKVLAEQKANKYSKKTGKAYVPTKNVDKEVLDFIDDLLEDFNSDSFNDFEFIARVRQDRSYTKTYNKQKNGKMNPESIKDEYARKIRDEILDAEYESLRQEKKIDDR